MVLVCYCGAKWTCTDYLYEIKRPITVIRKNGMIDGQVGEWGFFVTDKNGKIIHHCRESGVKKVWARDGS